jgi:hypothetical protein
LAAKPIFEGAVEDRRRLLCARDVADGTVDWIEGFAIEGQAGRWIKNESVVWLHNRKTAVGN